MKIYILLFFIFFNAAVSAQMQLDDLVPYRKGKLWGLVHYDMQEFYKPVFDSIILQGSFYYGLSVFAKSKGGDVVAKVIYKGKKMFLTPDKKLKPASFEPGEKKTPQISRDEELPDTRIGGIADPRELKEGEERWIDSFYADYNHKKRVKVKQLRNGYRFYINGNHLSSFDCDFYAKERQTPEFCAGIILYKNKKSGYADLDKEAITIPVEYNWIKSHLGEPSWMMVTKDNLKGVIATSGKIIVPVRYNSVNDEVFFTYLASYPFVVGDKNGYHFVVYNGNDSKESSVNYDRLTLISENVEFLYIFLAEKKDRIAVVSGNDSVLVPFGYEKISMANERFVSISKNKKYGFADAGNGYYRVEPVYDAISDPLRWNFRNKGLIYYLFFVKRNGRRFFVDCFGREFLGR